jgi:hypothetical protein
MSTPLETYLGEIASASGSLDSDDTVLALEDGTIKTATPAQLGAGVADGDKGDIVVSGSGATWTIDNGAVTAAKVAADVATQAELDTLISSRQPLDSDLTAWAIRFAERDGVTPDRFVLYELAANGENYVRVKAPNALTGDRTITLPDEDGTFALTSDLDSKADKAQAINTQTGTTYTLVLADDGKYVRCTNAAGCTVTVPLNSTAAFPTGARVEGAATLGATTIVATGGVTINRARTLVTNGAMSGWSLLKVATDTWDLHGDFV